MTMGDQVTVTMTGGGPYGFRLFGGDNIPLSVAKIRRRSKAADAGLIEGDILLGINGYSCRGVNHSTAMSLAESSGDMLVFQLLRGADDQQSVEAAFRSLGDQLSSISPSALQASAAPSGGRPMINSNVTPASQYHRQERTIQDADTTTRVTTETRTDTLGDSSYRQTTTQRLTTSNYGAVSPRRAVSPLQPLGHAQRNPIQPQSTMRVSAPSGVNVQQNRDHSVTMTIGVPNEYKENVAPQPTVPMFKVSKVTGAQSNGIWTPGAGGMQSRPAPRPAPQRSPSPRFNAQQKWQPPPPSKLAAQAAQRAPRAPSPVHPEPTPMTFTVDLGQDVAITPSDFRSSHHETDGEPPLPVDIQKLMFGTHGRDSECSTPDSPATIARKKKIYADSSFYDDPEHKYPTIEEQIKMARSVALSLMAPQNKRARGHTMFMKRRQGASRWVAGLEPEPYDHVDTGPATEEAEKYYRPAPWTAGDQTWRPVGAPKPYMPPQQPQQQYQPPPQQMQQQPQQPAPEPYERGWGQPDISARTWGRSAEPVYGQQPQQQPQQQQYQPQPPQQQLQPAPAYGPVRSPARGPVPPPASAPAPPSGKAPHTWQPPSFTPKPAQPQQPQEAPSWGQSTTPTQQPAWDPPKAAWEPPPPAPPPAAPVPFAAPPPPPPPPAPPLPDDSMKTMWRTPQLPSMKDKDKLNALSHDEFEKARLFENKNLHNQVSPQMCFNLANDLRNMKGKGGKLFAKRRARAEQWVVDEQPTNTGPDRNVMEKIAGQVAMEQARQNANIKTQPQLNSNDMTITPKARLEQMIAKPAMSPWEAAAGGNIDAAFSHMNKRNTIHGDNIVSGGWKNPTMPSAPGPSPATSLLALSGQAPPSSMPSSRNDYTRKIKGWSSVGATAPTPSNVGNVKPVSAPSFNAMQSYGASNRLSPAQRPQHLSQERAPSPRQLAPSPRQELASPCYQTPPQRQSPQPQAMQPATNGEVFYDAQELPAGCAEGEGYSDM